VKKDLKNQELKIKKLKEELKEVFKIANLKKIDAKNINEDDRIFQKIQTQKRVLINKIILDDYLWIDSRLNILIKNFFFKSLTEDHEFLMNVVDSREYKIFDSEILMEMPFMRKVSILKQIINIPKNITSNINKINNLRNAITHTLVPQRLSGGRTLYDKRDIYEVDTIIKFEKDFVKTSDFLQKLFMEGFKNDIYNKNYE
jgi:hypothetical protein